MAAEWYEIQPEDVGRRRLRVFGREWAVDPIRPEDVGRRVYNYDGTIYYETDEDRDARCWDRRVTYRRTKHRRVGERRL